MKGACKNCSDRHIGCHATCERYAADCAKRQQINEARRKLKFCEDAVEVHVFDDGAGCEHIQYGNGLQGMYNRVKEKQGSLKINSQSGEGFQTVIKLPLNT